MCVHKDHISGFLLARKKGWEGSIKDDSGFSSWAAPFSEIGTKAMELAAGGCWGVLCLMGSVLYTLSGSVSKILSLRCLVGNWTHRHEPTSSFNWVLTLMLTVSFNGPVIIANFITIVIKSLFIVPLHYPASYLV